ncbi:uncharacterized protein LOC111108645 [Crassostrea virginica]
MDYIPPITLPYGKEYHLFLSFCNEDEEIAFPLLMELEEKYRLKCLYHIRDFIPGVSVTENILNGIEKSMKIVYLISQKFKENFMCKEEILYGITASHKQCENSMIPFLLEKIDMPRELQSINYVDATLEGIDVTKKIYEVCVFGATSNCILPNVIPFQELCNGTILRVFKRSQTWKWGIPVIRFSEDKEMRKNISDEDRSRKIDQLCRLLLEDLNSSIFTTRYFMHSSEFSYRAAGLFLLGLPSFAVLPLLLYLIIVRTITEETLIGLCCTLVGVPVIAVCIAYGVAWYRNLNQDGGDLETITWKYLTDNYQTLKILLLLRSTKEVVVLNYDTEECKKFCIFALKRKMIDEDEIEREAEKMVLDFIDGNRRALADWSGLPEFKYNRHNTYAQKKCICQCLESKLF